MHKSSTQTQTLLMGLSVSKRTPEYSKNPLALSSGSGNNSDRREREQRHACSDIEAAHVSDQ